MINLPSIQQLKELQDSTSPLCTSVYMPLINQNTATNPYRIELKNLLREANEMLQQAGASPQDIEKTLGPARRFVTSDGFWPRRHESIVFYMHPTLFRYYYLPAQEMTPHSLVTVQTGFYLDPLLEIINDNRQYYVLVLGHKNVRLYEGDRYRMELVDVRKLPTDLIETLQIDEYPQSRETHTVSPTSRGKGSEAYHEQYNVSQTNKSMLREFFRRIDRSLHDFLRGKHIPLILAGVGYLLPIYRKVNSYPHLLDGAILGNQDSADLETLHQKANTIVGVS